jgi:hypothetical protein
LGRHKFAISNSWQLEKFKTSRLSLADRCCSDSLVRDSQEPSGQFAETPYTISLQLWLEFITDYGNTHYGNNAL